MAISQSCCQDIEAQPQEVEVLSACSVHNADGPFGTEGTASTSASSQPSTAANSPCADPPLEGAERQRVPRRSFKRGVHRVDASLMRGISLKATLHGGGSLWRRSPLELSDKERASLWGLSKIVKQFDLFLSHAWATRGFWKFLSLSFYFGWPHALIAWFLMVGLLLLLAGFNILPMPASCLISFQGYEAYCPCGSWVLLVGVAVSVLAFILAPYLPHPRPQTCFLDVVSINQVDQETKLQGIYGLGGFLKASKELRILWSPPYLSRLWCIFELAAFRSANPNGTVTLAPLCVEAAIAAFWVGGYVTVVLFLFVLELTGSYSILALLPALLPLFLVLHCLRTSLSMERQLFGELEAFDLRKVKCRKECDRDFVHAAIAEWYGSLENFTAYVRGPLRQELQAKLATGLPLHYSFLIVTPMVSMGLDAFIALWLAGAPTEIVLSYAIGVVLGLCTCWAMVTVQISMLLCGCFASTESTIKSWAQSLAVFLLFGATAFAGVKVGAMAYTHSILTSCIWLATVLGLLWLTHGGLQQMRGFAVCCQRCQSAET